MTSSSDENHVTMVLQGGYNKCFIQTDITPKANLSCNLFGKNAFIKVKGGFIDNLYMLIIFAREMNQFIKINRKKELNPMKYLRT